MKIALVCGFPFLRPTNGVEVRLQRTAEQLATMAEVRPVLVPPLPTDRIADLERTYVPGRRRPRAQAHRTWAERLTPEAIAPVFPALLRSWPAAFPKS